MAFTKKNWFRLSLRTLFVLVTVICCWLGWELSIVRQRQAMLKEIKQGNVYQVTTTAAWEASWASGQPFEKPARISLVRQALGDEAVQEIWYTWYKSPSKEELARVQKVFPEAQLKESMPPPCHPGCFPAGTLVETPRGPRAIETIRAGEPVTIVVAGSTTSATVQAVFVTDNRLWEVETTSGTLLTTQTQPLCLDDDRIVQVGDLSPGQRLLLMQQGQPQPVEVLATTQTTRITKVFNLILGDSQIFIANGYLARSKPPAVEEEVPLPLVRK